MTELTPEGTALSIDLMMLVDGIRKRVKAGDVYEIAEGAGVTPPTLYEFVGKRRLPTIPTLQKLIDYFGITVDAATHKQVLPPVPSNNSQSAPSEAA
jgi:transcriptional regulator with XRE-family HTH domain